MEMTHASLCFTESVAVIHLNGKMLHERLTQLFIYKWPQLKTPARACCCALLSGTKITAFALILVYQSYANILDGACIKQQKKKV